MLLNITSNSGKEPENKQTSLKSGQKVYLYNDPEYRGTLMRPVEKTYPPKWTVALERGGKDAANVEQIKPIESPHSNSPETEIPFSDEVYPQESANIPTPSQTEATQKLEQQIRKLQNTIRHLEAENQIIRQQERELEQENQRLKDELTEAKNTIRRAKDISPMMRISLKRVLRLAHNACMDVQRTVGGWILKMGEKARKFRRLADIWEILSQEDWYLGDIFAPDRLIPLDKIKPPRPRTQPTPPEKECVPFFTPSEVIRRRNMGLPSGATIA